MTVCSRNGAGIGRAVCKENKAASFGRAADHKTRQTCSGSATELYNRMKSDDWDTISNLILYGES